MLAFALRTGVTGLALWLVTKIVPGVRIVGGEDAAAHVGVILLVALIFGLVNAIIKPVVQLLAIPFYVLTLGLFHVVVNALMLWITAWVTHTTHWGLEIDHFWWNAIIAAIALSLVGWALGLVMRSPERLTRV